MYAAWPTAALSGIATVVTLAIGNAIQLAGFPMPDPMPAALIAQESVTIALIAGAFVAVAVRAGLVLARCRRLTSRSAFLLAVVNVAVLGTFALAPLKTHAIKLDVPSEQTNPYEVPLTFWIIFGLALVAPVLAAYVTGRVARGREDAA
jgi:hypothetical protein